MNAAFSSGTDITIWGMNSGIDLMVRYDGNALEPPDDLLANFGRALAAKMPDCAFRAATIDGSIYAMPAIKDLATDIGYLYNETLLGGLPAFCL